MKVPCDCCNKEFEISASRYNWAIKNGWKSYCQSECRIKASTTSIKEKCFTCKKEMVVVPSTIKNSKSGHVFCSHSCSAKCSNNTRLPPSQETKQKLSKALKGKYRNIREERICDICSGIFNVRVKTLKTHVNKYCSKKCSNIGQWGSLPYTKEEVTNILNEIKNKNGNNAPSSHEIKGKLVHAVNKFFGSWNKGMEELGFIPNTEHMLRLDLTCIDGHRADSNGEKTIDDWFYNNKIAHERCKKYPNSKKNCDFYLTDYNIWVEYFGLAGNSSYDKCIEEKREICQENEMILIELYPKDLNSLDEIFKNQLDKVR